ncbi:putative carbonic anhydrase 3 isoform X2 [Cryptotermes secundus]|uniref:putative carbonic anhydrase 3 isoform X2 n=1 Tax=Cryptotermes secundus TaxID=105785 RepID=UPI000CD7B876|nr:putative carbonic anhydrase 3 isoform X2 [Cryptotermes secundus]
MNRCVYQREHISQWQLIAGSERGIMSPTPQRRYGSTAFTAHLFLLIFAESTLRPAQVEASGWTYKEGNNGPSDWPGMCQSGTRQSPIDLDPQTTVPGRFMPLVLLNYDRRLVANMTNNGHTVVLTVEQPCEVVMAAGGLPAAYHLEQIHFHWQSEHTFQGKRFPLEMHMVHYDRRFKKLEDAAKVNRGLAVLAVLFYETNEPNKQLQPILESISQVSHVEGIQFQSSQLVRLQDLLPDEFNYFYRYAGSLTTPHCDESVVWTVLAHLMPIGEKQVAQFHKVHSHHEPLTSNYRPLQKANNRRIYLQQPSEEYQEISASPKLYQTCFIVIVLGIFSMMH